MPAQILQFAGDVASKSRGAPRVCDRTRVLSQTHSKALGRYTSSMYKRLVALMVLPSSVLALSPVDSSDVSPMIIEPTGISFAPLWS